MHGHRGAPSVGVGKLLVRPPLSNLGKAQPQQSPNHLSWLEDRQARQLRGDRLDPYELGFEFGLPVFQKHGDDLSEIPGKLIQAAGLRVGTGKPGNVAHEQTCLEILLDYGGELPHLIEALSLECRGEPLCGTTNG